jgi:hypothetical protein
MRKSSTANHITPYGEEFVDIHAHYVEMRFTDGNIFPLTVALLTSKKNNNAMYQGVALLRSMSKLIWDKWISLRYSVGQSPVCKYQGNALQGVRLYRSPTRESWSWD